MMRIVLTEAAEQARNDIRLLLAEHLRASRQRARALPGRLPGFDPSVAHRARQLALTTIVAVAEHFSAERLRALPSVTENDTASWRKQETAWRANGVALTNLPAFESLLGFVEARNSIMHGLGRLTPRQLTSRHAVSVQDRLASAGIRIVRGALAIDESDLTRCSHISVEFVEQLDSAAP